MKRGIKDRFAKTAEARRSPQMKKRRRSENESHTEDAENTEGAVEIEHA
jgi:hypothetical protein